MFGTILIAQLASSAVFFYERKEIATRWAALFWAERVSDLVRELEHLDTPDRQKVLSAIVADKTLLAREIPGAPNSADDDQFIGQFKERVAALQRDHIVVTIAPANIGAPVDAYLAILSAFPPKGPASFYDVRVTFAHGAPVTFRLQSAMRTLPDNNNYLIYPLVLIAALFLGAFVVARGITVPLARIARAADAVGRGFRQGALVEEGPSELRLAARAFNSMQERLNRYLDSRTRVLAGMSHDLRTPITRMLLRAEALTDPSLHDRFTQDLEEMQAMVQGSLDMLKGLASSEPTRPIDVNALLRALQSDYAEMGFKVDVSGILREPLGAQPQALRRLLANLLDNSRRFASSAALEVNEDGTDVVFRVKDDGPGIPQTELERVMEPYFRLESSRDRTTGGTGLGLSIARDIAQAHGGHLRLVNRVEGGLEAIVTIPRPA
jgi:signal transduction histidine kinase